MVAWHFFANKEMNLDRALKVLEVAETASPKEIKQKYRDLVVIWHPDRHSDNPRRYKLSVQKMKELNTAYDCVRSFLIFKKDAEGKETESDQDELLTVKCNSCGTKNRIREFFKNISFKCGRCGVPLYVYQSADREDRWEQRTHCVDDECIGTLGSDSRCNHCGKAFEEGKKESAFKDIIREEEGLKQQTVKDRRKSILKKVYYASFVIALVTYLIFSISDKSKPPKAKPIENRPRIGRKISLKSSENIISDFNGNDRYYSKEYFSNINLDRDQITIIQHILIGLGYNIGTADGIIGDNTLFAFRKFSEDYYFIPGEQFPNDFIKEASFHIKIGNDYPDWREIYIGDEFELWINRLPDAFKNELLIDDIKNYKIVKYLLCLYKFDKENPPPLPLPPSGATQKNYSEGLSPLTIRTKSKDQHHFIKLVRQSDNKLILKAFIRGGETLTTEVPIGKCQLKSAVGKTWYGEKFLFGPNTAYSIADKIFDFRIEGGRYAGYTVELFLQPYGNQRTKEISAFAF